MATAEYGPMGPFKGKIGPLYAYIWNGKTIIRAKPKITKPRSIKQLAVQERMVVLSPFLNYITGFIAIGFELAGKEKNHSANNAAKSYNLTNAIKGEYPDLEIDYPQARLSQGTLTVAENAQVQVLNEGLMFSWTYDPYDPLVSRSDKTMLMAWFPMVKKAFYIISGVQRMELQELLKIPEELKGLEAETYISFITDDRKAISNSVYTGRVLF